MSRILVVGAGICGMGAAIMLAKDGHEVVVLERDPAPQPDTAEAAWNTWERKGIAQFHLGHVLLAKGRDVLRRRAPEALDRMRELGAAEVPMTPPPTLPTWTPRDGDDEHAMVGIRRPVIDTAMADVADSTAGLTVHRGVAVGGLLVADDQPNGVPHVIGVVTESGEEVPADLVIDAMGRRSPMLRWLEAIEAPPAHEESVDSGFAYYGQYFRSQDGERPDGVWGLTPFDGYSILALPGDSGTWFIGVYASSNDKEMRALRNRNTLHQLLESCPLHAGFLRGDEVSDVISMVGVTDRDRRFVVDGAPVVTGMVPVADSWACTNPSLGRGMSIGLMHAELLTDFLSDAPDDPTDLVIKWDDITHTEMMPWHHTTRATDQARAAELDAQRQGRQLEPDPDDVGAQIQRAFAAALPHDEDVFRMFWELFQILDLPQNIVGRPGNFEKLIAASEGREPLRLPGPTRAEFLAGLSA